MRCGSPPWHPAGVLHGESGLGSQRSREDVGGLRNGIVSEGGAGSGLCIGGCGSIGDYGGGAIACGIWSCGSATVDPSWAQMVELEKEKKFWIGEDELARLNWEVMPNGRPVDQPNFWFASEKVQNDSMAMWSPTMSDARLAFSWMEAGGLESVAAMERTANVNPGSAKLKQWREMQQVAASLQSGGPGDMLFGIYNDVEKNEGVGASVGLAQLEIYKVRMMMWYGKEERNSRRISDYMKNGAKHYLGDNEAAIAYCGCFGGMGGQPRIRKYDA